jgi:RNA polymerase sigma factor (sigma-70 family)
VRGALARSLGREPEVPEVAAALGVTAAEVESLRSATRQVGSLDDEIPGLAGQRIGDALPDPNAVDPIAAIADGELGPRIRRLLRRLDAREKAIIGLRFGLGEDADVQTLEQIGESLGLSRERIRQIETQALSKLRRWGEAERLGASL